MNWATETNDNERKDNVRKKVVKCLSVNVFSCLSVEVLSCRWAELLMSKNVEMGKSLTFL